MRILITAPSLDENRNVSGISTIVRQIIDHGTNEYRHFQAGREDGEAANAAWILKQAALPLRFFAAARTERPDIVHINTALTDLSIWRDAALAAAAKLAGRRLIVAVHGGKYLMNPFTNSRLENITERMLRRADTVIVYSELEESALRKRWPDLNIRILANAIPFSEVPHPERNNPVPVLIFFGRMHESKGLHELIEAARRLNEHGVEFEIRAYGDGPLRGFFIDGMTKVAGDKFQYGGVIAGREKWARLAEADIFVLPSRYGEGLPMAMLEAMAVGCVVVVADVASVVAVVNNGENGFVVEPGNAGQLTAVLEDLIRHPEKWGTVRENAIATVRDNFGIEEYIETLESIYAEAIGAA